jgi:peptidoglycan/LPS O-acetylase OafA/YrhL
VLILIGLPATSLATPAEAAWFDAHQWWYWGHLTNVLGEKLGRSGPFNTGHFWSLAVEEQFYLVWPWLILGASFPVIRRTLPAVAVVSMMLWLVRGTYGLSPWLRVGLYVLPLAAGAMVALRGHENGLAGLGRPARRVGLAALLVLAGIGTAGAWVNPRQALIPLAARPVLAVLFTCVLLVLLTNPSGRLAAWCRTGWLVRLGVISYGLYVIHNPLRTLLPRLGLPVDLLAGGGLGSRFVYIGVMIGCSVALAELSFRYFEAPFLRLKDRVGGAGAQRRPLPEVGPGQPTSA